VTVERFIPTPNEHSIQGHRVQRRRREAKEGRQADSQWRLSKTKREKEEKQPCREKESFDSMSARRERSTDSVTREYAFPKNPYQQGILGSSGGGWRLGSGGRTDNNRSDGCSRGLGFHFTESSFEVSDGIRRGRRIERGWKLRRFLCCLVVVGLG
jgi:hypothetical protein